MNWLVEYGHNQDQVTSCFLFGFENKRVFYDLGDQILNGRLGLAPHRNFNNISILHPDVRTGTYNQSFGMPAQHEFQTVLEKRCDRHKNIIVQLN